MADSSTARLMAASSSDRTVYITSSSSVCISSPVKGVFGFASTIDDGAASP